MTDEQAVLRRRLEAVYPAERRSADAARLGISTRQMKAIVLMERRPGEDLAARISAETGIAYPTLRQWDFDPPAGVRWRRTDPMPMARADERWEQEHRKRYSAEVVRQLMVDLPDSLRPHAQAIVRHYEEAGSCVP